MTSDEFSQGTETTETTEARTLNDLDAAWLQPLIERMGREAVAQRLERQSLHWAAYQHQGDGLLRLEKFIPIDAVVRAGLKLASLRDVSYRHFLNPVWAFQNWRFPPDSRCPDGLRILHLSDLHLDLDTALTPVLKDRLAGLDYDLAVITGDFRNSTRDDFNACLEEVDKVLEVLHGPIFGILGNHDFLEMAPRLEERGVRLLLNEGQRVQTERGDLFLAGLDDPHFYRNHDFERAFSDYEEGLFSVLMVHSPEVYEAAEERANLMLCGHTHGGQICLPGGWAIVRNGRCPRKMDRGVWQYGRLAGYTSPGTGSCGVPARLFSRPEVTLHTLRSA